MSAENHPQAGEDRVVTDAALPAASVAIPPAAAATPSHARLLVVDDDVMNVDLLKVRLEIEGYEVATAPNGKQALEHLRTAACDLVLLDIVMPEMDGYAVLQAMKGDERFRNLPVIMISGLDDLNSVAQCIELGADDYLPKPFKPILLRARINACLEKKQLREQEQATYRALVESQKHLAAELAEAADYVRSLLPPPLTEGVVTTDWRFVTSTSLGGDSFGYHWIDDNHFAMYLLDVCGHGVGAALLSISAINVLRSQSLAGTDFLDPGAVLRGLNETFQMDRQNNMYFTIWYGVFNKAKREIRFARGGHPPAILVTGETAAAAKTVELKAPGMVIGSMPGLNFRTITQPMGPYSTLYLYSDGVYEVTRPDGTMWEFQDFVTELLKPPPPGQSEMDVTMRHAQSLQGRETFDDDFSMVKFCFA
jgi:sigma-B regulation protein RsbU (phosphoserine phosphatase)